MEFVMLESRGGNYLVVAQNVAWLRTAENGQTSVGIVGGQPLLVVGSIQEVADKILGAASETNASDAQAPAEKPAAVETATPPQAPKTPAEAAPVAQAAAQETDVPFPKAQAPAAAASERPQLAPVKLMSLSDRLALAAVQKDKAGSQRFMGASE